MSNRRRIYQDCHPECAAKGAHTFAPGCIAHWQQPPFANRVIDWQRLAATQPCPWPAPNPDTVVIEEEFDHYRIYLPPQWECTASTLDDALKVHNTHVTAHTPTGGYPLQSQWDIAIEAVSALHEEVERLDQDWTGGMATLIGNVVRKLARCNNEWIEAADDDGRTW